MFLKEVRIQQGGDSPVAIDLDLTNSTLNGWSTGKVMKVK